MKKKIGIYIWGPKDWYAGISFLKAITACAKKHYPDNVSFYLILDQENTEAEKSFAGLVDKVVILDRGKRTFFEKAYGKLIQKDYWLEKILLEIGLDYVLTCNLMLDIKHIKTLYWLPDFQHKYYPEYFSLGEVADRDLVFKRIIKKAHNIMVMSESVKEDCKKFLPSYKRNPIVVRAILDPVYFDIKPDNDVLSKYNLPKDFVYVPNQFWKHKNHAFLFKTIKLLKKQGHEFNFVFTGSTNDYRNPLYFSSLLQMIAELDIKDNVHILGMIDRKDVFVLYKKCRFVLNPSNFEGFGMTASEAKACGKVLLLSDIPAHREFSGTGCRFFSLSSYEDLASKIKELYKLKELDIDYDYETQSKITAENFMRLLEKPR